jgi:hypothetical protein
MDLELDEVFLRNPCSSGKAIRSDAGHKSGLGHGRSCRGEEILAYSGSVRSWATGLIGRVLGDLRVIKRKAGSAFPSGVCTISSLAKTTDSDTTRSHWSNRKEIACDDSPRFFSP